MGKVVMTGTVGVMQPPAIAEFKKLVEKEAEGAEFEFLFDLPVSDDELIAKAKGAQVIVTQYQPMTDKIYKALLPELKVVISYGIGTNAADPPVAAANGVMVANVPDYCQDEVATHAVAMILACQRRLPNLAKWIGEGKWGGGFQTMVPKKRFAGSTVGLYGFGRIPRDVAKMLGGFGLTIISHDPFVKDEDMLTVGVKPVSFDELVSEADYLSLHAPYMPATHGVINAEVFKKMKPSATLINTARGGLVDPQALYDALVNKQIDFAALDVFIAEPPAGIEKQIIDLPNVLITPHVGYYSDTAMVDLMIKTAEECGRGLRSEPLRNWVNRKEMQ